MQKDDEIVKKGFGYLYDNNGQSDTIVDYNQFNSGEGETGTSIKKALIASIGTIVVLVGISWFTLNKAPTSFKDIIIEYNPFIEEVKKPISAKPMPLPNIKPKRPFAPLYQIKALLKDGNELRVDMNVRLRGLAQSQVPLADIHKESFVRWCIRKIVIKYKTDEMELKDRGDLQQEITRLMSEKAHDYGIATIETYPVDIQFDRRTQSMLDAQIQQKMAITRAKAQLEKIKHQKEVIEAEMELREYEQKRQLELKRKKALHEAQTLKMVNDILEKKKIDK